MNAGSERDGLLSLLAGWCDKAKSYRDAHQNASVRLRRWHYILGVPTIVLTSIVAMSVFATLQHSAPMEVVVGVGVLGVCAAVLAACQTFLRCADRAEAHRQASADYEGLAERAELVAALYRNGELDDDRRAKFREACNDVQARMALLATKRPEVSERDRRPRPEPAAPRSPVSPAAPVREAKAQASSSTSSSLIPPPGAAAPVSIPPPGKLPPATLPPVRPPLPHSSVRPQMPSVTDASSGRRSPSAPPPGVERWERRASASHTPPPVEDSEKEPQKAQRSQRAE